jgi:hypothetical protein
MAKSGKKRVALCPLCEAEVPLGPEGLPHRDQAAVIAHASTHTLGQWLNGTQELRDRVEQIDMLRNMPRCAMAQA